MKHIKRRLTLVIFLAAVVSWFLADLNTRSTDWELLRPQATESQTEAVAETQRNEAVQRKLSNFHLWKQSSLVIALCFHLIFLNAQFSGVIRSD